MKMRFAYILFAIVVSTGTILAADTKAPDYNTQVAPIFVRYCNGCHNAEDAEGKLVLESFSKLMRGGESGTAVIPAKSAKSRLILVLEKKVKPFMPPKGNKGPTAAEIAILKAWIDAGAKGPDGKQSDPVLLSTPKIKPVGKVRQPINSVAWSVNGKWFAVARYGIVEIRSSNDQKLVRTLSGHSGQVNDVGVSSDGTKLFAAAGEPGLFGEVRLWRTADWKMIRRIRGHRDSLYAAELNPNATLLATGSYDQKIKLWDPDTGEELRTLNGHNGAVFDLAFHPSGQILASASGDRTVKLWDVVTGKRLETFGQPEKAQYAVAFRADGRQLAAGGVDNRIRVWQIQQVGREGTNPILYTRFAHERPIIDLAFSPNGTALVSSAEDRTLKVWETKTWTQQRTLEPQSDWAPALAIAPNNATLLVGRLDGTLRFYQVDAAVTAAATATPLTELPVPKPHARAVAADKRPEVAETEPNDSVEKATPLPAPGVAAGVIAAPNGQTHDTDLFRFESKKDQTWLIETSAAKRKSPVDTRIEVLHADGKPVLRLLLQAVRDSYITFRPIDSRQTQARVKNWEEMELNQFLYMAGEVCKLFLAPRGPDSGYGFYSINGKRKCYFDTSATVHAKEDPVYIVNAYLPRTKLIDNGLPVFPLYFSNDDDADRKLGNDSRLTFTAPADGAYLVRVTDVQGFGGADYKYWLTVREPLPDFNVTIAGKNPNVGIGSGQRITFKVDRIDGFTGEIRIDVNNVPDRFRVPSSIVVQAGHNEARGVINAAPDAKAPKKEDWSKVKITATATINGKEVKKDVGNLGEIKVAAKPKIIVSLRPDATLKTTKSQDAPAAGNSPELIIAPGTTMTAMLKMERNGYKGEMKFDVDNLPHGVIVDNIGLSGVLIREGESERQIFLTAAKWVPESTRWIHAVAKGEGNQASLPLRIHVRKSGEVARANR